MNIAKRFLGSVLTLITLVASLAAMAATAGAAENGQKNANAPRQSQTASISRVTPGTQKGARGNVKLPGRIEYPNLTGSRRSADRTQLEPTSIEYPNVIESVGTKYTMLRRSRNGGADTKNTSAERRSVPASGGSHLLKSKNEVLIETRATDRVNRDAYWLPEIGDEVLAVRQSDNASSRMAGNQLRARR